MGSSGSKKKQNHPQGPVRHASESGVFIQLLEFPGIYGYRDSLLNTRTEKYTPGLKCVLGGYTFVVCCRFEFNEDGDETVSVCLYLQAGEWDNNVKWPFNKKTWVNITHPRDHEKDIWLWASLDEDRMTKRPAQGKTNFGRRTHDVTFQRLEHNGFIHNNKLYVNIELA
ncbi:hypothetical protein HPB49_020889 [Dermacentor silvarum]|uniref:Uncharacterized protein n=1 Tax=Dermacentor silvarum TaxID=543639 RepID=A0ACB8CZQ5_DERSI|nr:hypothetical protein HPB49_020889 [Dermacentor silvarum]